MPEVKVICRPNGPLLIQGPFELIGVNGEVIPTDPAKPAISLCRCGHTNNKPFCDGTHKTCGWQA